MSPRRKVPKIPPSEGRETEGATPPEGRTPEGASDIKGDITGLPPPERLDDDIAVLRARLEPAVANALDLAFELFERGRKNGHAKIGKT